MMSQALREARRYEEAAGNRIKEEERPAFHLSVRTGWMNDPNGFSYYDGAYHLFYQYYPYECQWNFMHWGHAVSKDLLHWEYLPAALAPDQGYDRDGCFSGSALTLPDGRQLLMYTGVSKEKPGNGGGERQTQCLAVGNGLDYEKYEKNPVITAADLPEGCSAKDFRDPKMWQREDGSYRCVVGNRAADGSGQILLFQSRDGFAWEYKSVLASSRNRFGKMWECPDFFKLGEAWVLLLSPQEMLPEGPYYNGNGTLCLIGDFDEETETFIKRQDQPIDCGIDFYAAQTMQAPDGRRIMVGWMQNWDACDFQPDALWFGQMSLPRELSVKDGKLYQKPVRELENLRCGKLKYEDVSFSGEIELDGISGRRVDMELSVRPEDGMECYRKLEIQVAKNKQYHTSLCFLPEESLLTVDRTFSGSRKAVIHQRSSRVNSENGNLKLRILLDRYSMEVFVNDGEQAMTTVIYTDQEADGISFAANGTVHMDIVKYNLV